MQKLISKFRNQGFSGSEIIEAIITLALSHLTTSELTAVANSAEIQELVKELAEVEAKPQGPKMYRYDWDTDTWL